MNDQTSASPEPWMPTSAVIGLLPGATNPRTVKALMVRGTRLPNGRVIRLKSVSMNGRSFTKRTWIDEFLREAMEASEQSPGSPAPVQVNPETPKQKERRLDAEHVELEELLGPFDAPPKRASKPRDDDSATG